MKTTTQPHGTVSLSADCKTLTITTQIKRGKKTEIKVVAYTVEDLRPQKQVAFPAFRLTKTDGEFYDVAIVGGFATCTCPHATYRGGNSRVPCKHYLALQAVQLLPKGRS